MDSSPSSGSVAGARRSPPAPWRRDRRASPGARAECTRPGARRPCGAGARASRAVRRSRGWTAGLPCRARSTRTTSSASPPRDRVGRRLSWLILLCGHDDVPLFRLERGRAATSRRRAQVEAETRSARAASWIRRSSLASRSTSKRARSVNSGGRPSRGVRRGMRERNYHLFRKKINRRARPGSAGCRWWRTGAPGRRHGTRRAGG